MIGKRNSIGVSRESKETIMREDLKKAEYIKLH